MPIVIIAVQSCGGSSEREGGADGCWLPTGRDLASRGVSLRRPPAPLSNRYSVDSSPMTARSSDDGLTRAMTGCGQMPIAGGSSGAGPIAGRLAVIGMVGIRSIASQGASENRCPYKSIVIVAVA